MKYRYEFESDLDLNNGFCYECPFCYEENYDYGVYQCVLQGCLWSPDKCPLEKVEE